MGVSLMPKGMALVESRLLPDEDRAYLYREDPYAAFVARQFRAKDDELFDYLRDKVLRPLGISALDGKVDGIEVFRGDLLRKIRDARYFVCILTHREQLRNEEYASSVWLYQEIGAAVALGKSPLVLVEQGLSNHYAGELQKNYEYEPFARDNFAAAFYRAGQRLRNDQLGNSIVPRVPD